jgi:hypothetical protein
MRLKFAFAFVISLMLLVASKAQAGAGRTDLIPTVKVLVFSTTKDGKWHSRLAMVHAFSDTVITVCFEWPQIDAPVQCLVIASEDGATVLVPMHLLEIKT